MHSIAAPKIYLLPHTYPNGNWSRCRLRIDSLHKMSAFLPIYSMRVSHVSGNIWKMMFQYNWKWEKLLLCMHTGCKTFGNLTLSKLHHIEANELSLAMHAMNFSFVVFTVACEVFCYTIHWMTSTNWGTVALMWWKKLVFIIGIAYVLPTEMESFSNQGIHIRMYYNIDIDCVHVGK